jgi:ABC-2 type transport system permease protein
MPEPALGPRAYLNALLGIVWREALRFLQQRARLIAALVRPTIWLLVFAVGFRSMLEVARVPPYHVQIGYETYVVPGLLGMIQLFNGMQSSLSLVVDRELGSMRLLLSAPLPTGYLLFCKLLAGVALSLIQIVLFVLIAEATVVDLPLMGLLRVLPVLLLTGVMLGAIGLLLSATVRELENFAGVMNFVVFPLFFLSSALYPLVQMRASSETLYWISLLNPFTHAVEAIRFAVYGELAIQPLLVVAGCSGVGFALALRGYRARTERGQR